MDAKDARGATGARDARGSKGAKGTRGEREARVARDQTVKLTSDANGAIYEMQCMRCGTRRGESRRGEASNAIDTDNSIDQNDAVRARQMKRLT